MSKIQLTVTGIIADLKAGLSRYEKDDFGKGSIQAKYGLSKSDVVKVFKNEKLKGLKVKGKTRKQDNFELVDDSETTEVIMESNNDLLTQLATQPATEVEVMGTGEDLY